MTTIRDKFLNYIKEFDCFDIDPPIPIIKEETKVTRVIVNGESYMILFRDNGILLRNLDRRTSEEITEDQLYAYTNIFIDMFKLKSETIRLRKKLINSDIKDYLRSDKINKIMNE